MLGQYNGVGARPYFVRLVELSPVTQRHSFFFSVIIFPMYSKLQKIWMSTRISHLQSLDGLILYRNRPRRLGWYTTLKIKLWLDVSSVPRSLDDILTDMRRENVINGRIYGKNKHAARTVATSWISGNKVPGWTGNLMSYWWFQRVRTSWANYISQILYEPRAPRSVPPAARDRYGGPP